MALLTEDAYKRQDDEVLELITPERAKEPNDNGNLPLHLAARYSKSVAVVEALIKAHEGALREKNSYSNLPLHVAAWGNSAEVKAVFREAQTADGVAAIVARATTAAEARAQARTASAV